MLFAENRQRGQRPANDDRLLRNALFDAKSEKRNVTGMRGFRHPFFASFLAPFFALNFDHFFGPFFDSFSVRFSLLPTVVCVDFWPVNHRRGSCLCRYTSKFREAIYEIALKMSGQMSVHHSLLLVAGLVEFGVVLSSKHSMLSPKSAPSLATSIGIPAASPAGTCQQILHSVEQILLPTGTATRTR